jgi:Flp pilus assembly protein TadG
MKRSTRSDCRPAWRALWRKGARAPREEGAALYEFALVLPLLVMMLVGIIKFGILFYDYVVLADAVAAGARTLATNRSVGTATPNACQLAQTAVQTAAYNLNQASLTVPTPTLASGSCTALAQGTAGTVTATYPCNLTIPFVGNMCPATTISSQTTVRIE